MVTTRIDSRDSSQASARFNFRHSASGPGSVDSYFPIFEGTDRTHMANTGGDVGTGVDIGRLRQTPEAATADELDLLRLEQLCFPRWDARIATCVLRPQRPEYTTLMLPPPNDRWDRVLQRLRIMVFGIAPTLDLVFAHLHINCYWVYIGVTASAVFEPLAAVLYDQECSGDQSLEAPVTELKLPSSNENTIRSTLPHLFEHMLLIDYGIGVFPPYKPSLIPGRWYYGQMCPQVDDFCRYFVGFISCWKRGRFPSWKGMNYLSSAFTAWQIQGDLSDTGLMLYYYYTRRHTAGDRRIDYSTGTTRYTGVLQEFIDEVPVRGPDRLIRKLSADVNELIPRVVQNITMRKRMLDIAKAVAAKHGLTIVKPTKTSIPEPKFETLFKSGLPAREDYFAKGPHNSFYYRSPAYLRSPSPGVGFPTDKGETKID